MSLVQSKAGLQMVETVIRYLPRITVCLEEIAKSLSIIALNSNSSIISESTEKISKTLDVLTEEFAVRPL